MVTQIAIAGGNVGPSTHVCALVRGPEELYDVLGPFVRDGLEDGDKLFHIVDPELKEQHAVHLKARGIDLDRVTREDQVEICDWNEAYLRGGRFDPDEMLTLVDQVLTAHRDQGYTLTRIVAQMEWGLREEPGVEGIVEYESRLARVLPKYNNIGVCVYDVTRFSAGLVMDIMRTHPAVILGGLLYENPFYVPPDRFLQELAARGSHQPTG